MSFQGRSASAIFRLALVLVSFSLLSSHLGETAEGGTRTYTLAVIPSAPPVVVHQAWAPFVERLATKTGLSFKLKLYNEMTEFERELEKGSQDFIFVSPTQIVVAHGAQQYIPLLRSSNVISGVLFVRKDSPVHRVRDLQGKEIAFVGAKNVCSVFTRQALSQETDLKFRPLFAGSTGNVFKMVELGKTDAGATLDADLERDPMAAAQFRAILRTAPMAPHPLAAHPRIPVSVRETVIRAVFLINEEKAGAGLLASIRLAAPVRAEYDRDYRGLESIDIRSLTRWGR